jgi:isopentenyl-diphosphate delta-isomerase
MPNVILVDEQDNPIGQMEKLQAHQEGKLHRAFSIFVFNSKNELLLQQRALVKYHSGGLWSNTVCGHPEPGEDTTAALHRRVPEELGFDCPAEEMFTFLYRTNLDHNLIENEIDHVFKGFYEGEIKPNPEEVMDYKWVDLDSLQKDIDAHLENYTYWMKLIMPRIRESV